MARTLSEIIDACLPEIPVRRYSDEYWIKKANFVLDELSTKLTGSYRETEVIVPLVEGVTKYRIPSQLRRPERIRYPAGNRGVTIGDPRTKVDFVIVGDSFRILEMPVMNSDVDLTATQTLPDGNPLQYSVVEDLMGMLEWPDDIEDRGAIITHYSAPGIVSGQESTFVVRKYTEPFVVRAILNGSLEEPAKLGDTIFVTSNFVIVSGPRSLRHFTTMDSLSPLPTEFDRVLGKGLLLYLRMAMDDDNTGPSISAADEFYRRDVEELIGDHEVFGSDKNPVQPVSQHMFSGLMRPRR